MIFPCPKCGSADLLTDGSCMKCGYSPFDYTSIIQSYGKERETKFEWGC